VSTFESAKLHYDQFIKTPLDQMKPVINRGTPAEKVVATMEVPDNHQGRSRPDRKKSVVVRRANR